jgi:hypothetical protein
MTKFISAFFLITGVAFVLPQAAAQTEPSASTKASTKTTTKKPVKKKAAKKKVVVAKEEPASDKEDEKIDTTGLSSPTTAVN